MSKIDREILLEDLFCLGFALIPVMFFVIGVVEIVHALLFR